MKKHPLRYFFAFVLCLSVITTAGISSAAESGRTSNLLDGTMLGASVLSSSIVDAYNDLIIAPLSEAMFNFLYSDPEATMVTPTAERTTVIAEPAPVVNVAAPITNIDLTTLIRKILQDEITYSPRGAPGPVGPQGPAGPTGSQGSSGNSVDTSSFVSQNSFDNQVDAILTSMENSADNLTNSIEDGISANSLLTSSVGLNGSTSGTVTIVSAAAAGTYTLTLPTDDGAASQVLQTDGNGVLTWATVASSGATTALDNLASVAINTSLVSDTDNTDDLGTSDIGWRTGYFDTSAVTPSVIGGSATTQGLTFKTTSGIGASGADMHFLVGNNGATEAITILNSGNVGIGNTAPDKKLDITSSNSTTLLDLIYTNTDAVVSREGITYSFTDSGATPGAGRIRSAMGITSVYDSTITSALSPTEEFYSLTLSHNTNPTISSNDVTIESHVADFSNSWAGTITGSNPVIAMQGISVGVSGDAGTSGAVTKYGVTSQASGTADSNAAFYVANVTGATNNYGVYINSPTSAAGNYALYSAATAQSYFAGNVGIGTTAPAGLLHVSSDTAATGLTFLTQANASLDSFDLNFRKARGTGASPTVITTADELGVINFTGYGGAAGYITGAAIKGISSGTIADSRVPGKLSFWTGTNAAPSVLTERLTIDQSGNITQAGAGNFITGTGEITLSGNTTVSSGKTFSVSPTGGGNITFTNATLSNGAGLVFLDATSSSNFVPAMSIAMTQTATGSLTASYGIANNFFSSAVVTGAGVGQTLYGAYNTMLKIGADTATGTSNTYANYNTAENTGRTDAGTVNTYGGYFSALGDTAGTSTTYGVYATASGADTNYGVYSAAGTNYFAGAVGDATPDYGLDVVADINSDDCFRESGVQVAGTCASDINLKKNVTTLENSLEKIMELRPVTFEWKEGIDSNEGIRYVAGVQTGLIAQEVETVFPEWVSEKYGFKAVQYNLELQMRLIKATQELNLKLESIAMPLIPEDEKSFTDRFFAKITEWLADAGNGLSDIFAGTFRAKDKLCINETCVTEAQLIELLGDSGISSSSPAPSVPDSEENTATEEPLAPDTTTPETTEETPAPDITETTETAEPPAETPAETEETITEPEPTVEEPAPESEQVPTQ